MFKKKLLGILKENKTNKQTECELKGNQSEIIIWNAWKNDMNICIEHMQLMDTNEINNMNLQFNWKHAMIQKEKKLLINK